MNKGLAVALSVLLIISLAGCKKRTVPEEPVETINLDTLETSSIIPSSDATDVINLEATVPQGMSTGAALEPISGPSNEQIQTALKNAGLYSGLVDGKIGPKTKNAIKEFQSANGLNVDGKVGTKTWAKLSAYLNTAASTAAPAQQ